MSRNYQIFNYLDTIIELFKLNGGGELLEGLLYSQGTNLENISIPNGILGQLLISRGQNLSPSYFSQGSPGLFLGSNGPGMDPSWLMPGMTPISLPQGVLYSDIGMNVISLNPDGNIGTVLTSNGGGLNNPTWDTVINAASGQLPIFTGNTGITNNLQDSNIWIGIEPVFPGYIPLAIDFNHSFPATNLIGYDNTHQILGIVGDNEIDINETTDSHSLVMNNTGVVLTSGNSLPLDIVTSELELTIGGSNGNNNQVLTSNGTLATWENNNATGVVLANNSSNTTEYLTFSTRYYWKSINLYKYRNNSKSRYSNNYCYKF